MTSKQVSEALAVLNTTPTLSILSLSEPVLASDQPSSENNGDSLHPLALQADLTHYKDLFGKLRFSYVEQVTKERFLKAIVADPPELVDAAQNAELEAHLVVAKAALKQKKVDMEAVVQELEDLGRRLAQTYEIIQLQTTQLESLPEEIAHLEAHISALESAQAPTSADPDMNLSLHVTTDLLSSREKELQDLNSQLADMQSLLPRKKREVANLEAELAPLETRKRVAIEEAKDAQRKRGNGGMAKELEERGRWLKGVEGGLRLMLDV